MKYMTGVSNLYLVSRKVLKKVVFKLRSESMSLVR